MTISNHLRMLRQAAWELAPICYYLLTDCTKAEVRKRYLAFAELRARTLCEDMARLPQQDSATHIIGTASLIHMHIESAEYHSRSEHVDLQAALSLCERVNAEGGAL